MQLSNFSAIDKSLSVGTLLSAEEISIVNGGMIDIGRAIVYGAELGDALEEFGTGFVAGWKAAND